MGLSQWHVTSVFERRGHSHFKIFPSRWRQRQSSFLESILVVIHHWCRAIERHSNHFAAAVRIEGANTADVVVGIKANTVLRKQILYREDSSLCIDDRSRTSIKDLDDVWLLLRTESCNSSGHGVFITTFVHWGELVGRLSGIVVSGDSIHGLTQSTFHCMPPLNFSLGPGARSERNECYQ